MYNIIYNLYGQTVMATPERFESELAAKQYIENSLDKTIEYHIVPYESSLYGFKEFWENKLAKENVK